MSQRPEIEPGFAKLELSASADDILGVSPAPSDVDDPDIVAASRPPEFPFKSGFSSLTPLGRPPISPSPLGEDPADAAARRHVSVDAFSSSSDEEQSITGSEAGTPTASFSESATPPKNAKSVFSQSEFDKALISSDGVPNTGSASFDKDTVSLVEADNYVVHESSTKEASSQSSEQLHPREVRQSRASRKPRLNHRHASPAFVHTGTVGTTASSSSGTMRPPPPPPPGVRRRTSSMSSRTSDSVNTGTSTHRPRAPSSPNLSAPGSSRKPTDDVADLSTGVLPDVLMTMRQKIESMTLFDSDMMRLAQGDFTDDDLMQQETREQLKRSSQQSISASVLVSLAHKRYERRRLAAMEIEKVVRSLVQQGELERVRAILLLLSDDYVRSTSEDARKGGVVALAACAIGLKKAPQDQPDVLECRDLILASVVNACQDHSQRVRYYATESLFNVLKALPALAVQHFFILFEILRALYADVDVDVRSGAQLLDKRLKEWIVGAINTGSFTAHACVPIFARFVYMRNKATKRLTLSWLQELNEKLPGAPVLEFLHLFLNGIFAMVADPNISIRESALQFLQGVLPKLLHQNAAIEDETTSTKADFDKILQGLVTTLEHPDPFVRKVAMYWMSRIVQAYMGPFQSGPPSSASLSVRNSLPHVLPGILLSIGDTFHNLTTKRDSFLPEQTTRSLAEQTNLCLQEAVRRDGKVYVAHLDGLIMALREELDSPSGVKSRHPTAVERKPYRMDVASDGTGIESPGWFRTSEDKRNDESMMLSRLCALHWVNVLYESVVPDTLKADYAREFISSIIRQLVDTPPEGIIFKSLEVLATITIPVTGEVIPSEGSSSSLLALVTSSELDDVNATFPMNDESAEYALNVLPSSRRQLKSRDRRVFSALVQLHAHNQQLLADLSKVLQFMCQLQPPEFVFVSFAVELDRFFRKQSANDRTSAQPTGIHESTAPEEHASVSHVLEFTSAFIQQMSHIFFTSEEAAPLRNMLRDCIGKPTGDETDDTRGARLFHILLHSFSHNLASTVSLCLWGGAYRTASWVLTNIDPLDINLGFLIEVDKLVELLERPLFRHVHMRMLEWDGDPGAEGSGSMLFQALKSLLMIVPQSTCYRILRERLTSMAKFRQSALVVGEVRQSDSLHESSEVFVERVLHVRQLHCDSMWRTIRAESLETPQGEKLENLVDADEGRREWLGYSSKEEETAVKKHYSHQYRSGRTTVEELHEGFDGLDSLPRTNVMKYEVPVERGVHVSKEWVSSEPTSGSRGEWKEFWAQDTHNTT